MKFKRFALTGLYLCCVAAVSAQNTYLSVSELTPDYAISPQLTDPLVGDRLFIYQHAGARVIATGGSAGQVTDLNGAGQFALATVARVSGDTLYFTAPVVGEFDPAFTQIVIDRGPADRTVAEGRAVEFDGRTGGILFLSATTRLTVTGELSASAAGFRGGAGAQAPGSCTFLTVANGLTYSEGNYRGARRGEGVAASTPATALGRAALANGGGGGNDHNTGGGGGANTVAGGTGAVNIVNSAFLCRGRFPGFGGNALPRLEDRLYFGGGGGAGHANNTDAAAGGRGGGIIVLWAPEVIFSPGSRLVAEGAPARTIRGDGAGGGGAGGSLLVYAGETRGDPLLGLRGGNGGSVENLPDRCFGPGGGGSGGRLLITGDRQAFDPDLQLAGGLAGLRLDSNICSAEDDPAEAGSTGAVQVFEIRRPFSAFQLSASFLCSGQSVRVLDQSLGRDTVVYRIDPSLPDVEMVADGKELTLFFPSTAAGSYVLTQLLVVGADTLSGQQATLTVGGLPTIDRFVIREVGDSVILEALGPSFVDEFVFDLGNGETVSGTQSSISYRYPEAGTYVPTVLLVNTLCGNALIPGSPVTVAEPLRAIIQDKDPSGCAPLTIDPRDLSQGEYGGRRWEFPGGNPATSTEERPVVTYAHPGRYTVTLTLTGTGGGRDSVATMEVNVFDTPVADFEFVVGQATVSFQNRSSGADAYQWTFGDGEESSMQNPTHPYAGTDTTYAVTLIARGTFCSDTLRRDIVVGDLTAVDNLSAARITVYPNPTTGRLFLTGPATAAGLYDLKGRKIANGVESLDLSDLPGGIYLLRLRDGRATITVRVVRQ